MTKKEKLTIKKEAKKMLYGMMNERDKVYILLMGFEKEHGFIPEEYKSDIMLMNSYKEYKRYLGWQKIPGVKLIINKAVQKYCKKKIENPHKEKEMTVKEKEIYLKRKTKEIYANVAKAKKEIEEIHNNS